MKKIFLSSFTVLSFVFYMVFFGKHELATYTETTPLSTNYNVPIDKPSPIQNTTTKPTPPTQPPATPINKGLYKNGNFIGDSVDAYYGYIQVKAIIQNGKLADIAFLDYPRDRNNSIKINSYALPILKKEAIKAQSSNVNIVSGATDSSLAFRQSLKSALARAKN